MQTPPMAAAFPYKAGYLMSVEAAETLSFLSKTCYDYTTTGGYSTTMTDVWYGRTSKYSIHDSSKIDYSQDRSN